METVTLEVGWLSLARNLLKQAANENELSLLVENYFWNSLFRLYNILHEIQHFPHEIIHNPELLYKKQHFSFSWRLYGTILVFRTGVLISQKKGRKRPLFRVMVSTTKPNRNEATS
jgi:hypothetical protein